MKSSQTPQTKGLSPKDKPKRVQEEVLYLSILDKDKNHFQSQYILPLVKSDQENKRDIRKMYY